MKIIILGANHVGEALAEQLSKERNDVTVVDPDPFRLQNLESRLDIRTITGVASYPSVLRQAGIENTDMLIAVTQSDEINMVACEIAYNLYRVPKKIARIRAHQYLTYAEELFSNENIAIDFCISPEQLVTDFIFNLIEYPGALQVLDFAEGKVQMMAIKPHPSSPLVGKPISEVNEHLNKGEIRIVAIYRNNRSISITGETLIELQDEVFFICATDYVSPALKAFGRLSAPYERIMLAGGGNVGLHLAQTLEGRYQVKILERDPERAEFISTELSNTTVLCADASDKDLLLNENIENMDVFCAITNEDEANIMSSLQAKRLGVPQVMSLIKRPSYVDLIEGGAIDIAISPHQVTVGSILRYLRKGDVPNVYSLRRGAAEALEIIVHGDERTSRIINKTIDDIPLPEGTYIGAIVRGNDVLIAHGGTVVKTGDHVLIFVLDKKRVADIERLFRSNF